MKKIIGIIIAMSLFLIGCGGSNVKDSEVKVYSSENGDVEIPTDPKAIVADYYVGELIKLEANVVGADLTYSSSLWGETLGGITDVGQSMEAVAALEPDLIITINESFVDQYKEIAPTVYIPYGKYNPEELMLELSKITNTEEVAEKWIEDFNNSIEELQSIVNQDETWTILELNGEDGYFYGEHFGRSGYILYDKLGLSSTQRAEEDYVRKDDSYINATVEVLPDYIGDNLILVTFGEEQYSTHHFLTNDVWKSLDVVANNKVHYVNPDDFWYTDPFSLDVQVELLKEIFSGNNEK